MTAGRVDCVRVALVDDDDAYRARLEAELEEDDSLSCVATFADCETAVTQLRRVRTDVVLLDVHFPRGRMDGIAAARCLNAVRPELAIVMLTVDSDVEQLFEAVSAGAVGYVLKDASPDEIRAAVREAAAGESPMNGQLARKVVNHLRGLHGWRSGANGLDKTNREILALSSAGFSQKEVASELGLAHQTVRNRCQKIYRLLQVHSRKQALRKFFPER